MIINSPPTALFTKPSNSGFNAGLHGGDTSWSVLLIKMEDKFTLM